MSDLRFYRAQERAFAPGIVKDWPKVWQMPRKVPHGRLVAVTVEQVIAELRENGYHVSKTVPPTCSTCVHLRPFELAPELNTCPVVNIRIHTESAAIFGCNQHEAAQAPLVPIVETAMDDTRA